jgi:hypothetical protein
MMNTLKSIIVEGLTQCRRNWKLLLGFYIPILLLFVVMALISRSSDDVSLSYFTRDVNAIGDMPFYAGLLSQLGLILWSAVVAVCLFSVLLLRYQNKNPLARRFLIQAGVLSLVLLLDDVYELHESVFPEYLGIREKYIYIFYFVSLLSILLLNLPEILHSEYSILGLSLAMFAVSAFFDGAHLDKFEQYGAFFSENIQTFMEDGPKVVGIATWLLYFTRYAILSQVPLLLPSAQVYSVKEELNLATHHD